MKVSTRLSLAEYFILRVCCFNPVVGSESGDGYWAFIPGSPPQYSDVFANREDQVFGQDLILFIYVILRIHYVEDSLKLYFIPLRNSVVNWSVKPLTLLFCFRSVCYGCMNPTTYVWVTCRDPGICGLSGSRGMPDSLPF